MADASPEASIVFNPHQSEAPPPEESITQSKTHGRPKAKVLFSYLPASTEEEHLESILKPFTIDDWCEDDKFVLNDGKKSITLNVLGTQEHRNEVQMLRELGRLWCRRNRNPSIVKSGPKPSTASDIGGAAVQPPIPGWLVFLHYADNSSVRKEDTVQITTLRSISFGSFKDQHTFVNHACIGQSTHTLQAKFEHDVRDLSIALHERNTNIVKRIDLSYHDLEAYVVLDILTDGFRMFLPLLHPPKVYSSELPEACPYIAHPQTYTADGYMWNRDTTLSYQHCKADVIGRSSVLCLEYRAPARGQDRLTTENSTLWTLYSRLQRNDFSLYFSGISGVLYEPKEFEPDPKYLEDFDTVYAIESLLSRGSRFSDRCTPELMTLISETPSMLAASAITELANFWLEEDRFCNLENIFMTEVAKLRDMSDSGDHEELPPHFVNVRRVVVTPTRILFLRAETIVENRTVREFGADRFLRVAFRDENYGKLMSPVPRFVTKITARIKQILQDGIVIGSRRYYFLACSNSQLREHGCWFYAPDGTHRTRITSIRRWMGDLSEERCVATYVARMGQFFSASKNTITVSIEDETVEEIPDIEIPYRTPTGTRGKYCFSDGVGTISQDLAEEVCKKLNMDNTPSAFQIRYAGCKGVVSTWPNPDESKEKTKLMQIRPSMKKFESKHKSIEVMATTHPGQLFMNRQVITILSQLGVRDEEFLQRQDKMLYRLADMFLYEDKAEEALSKAQPRVRFELLKNAGLSLTTEPHFRDILTAVYKTRLDDLLRRTRIEVDLSEGRIMMGIMDETGSLEYGQVFVQYSEDISKGDVRSKVLTGDVVVTKNPCFHPGDVRKFEAVDIEALHHCKDCIVFPAKGSRPHPNEISGSDLDGDMYWVTWAPGLQISSNEEPMDFTGQPKKVLNRKVTEEDIQDFVANYISSDQLGLIANAHLANADVQKEGIFSKICLELAALHSIAVDFPKTGKAAEMKKEHRPTRYPDYMTKFDKPHFRSRKVLGSLYRQCQALEAAANSTTLVEQNTPNDIFDHEGKHEYMQEALIAKDGYDVKLRSIMTLYGVNSEGELVSGCLTRVRSINGMLKNERFEISNVIRSRMGVIAKTTRREFYQEFGGEGKWKSKDVLPKVLAKAAAWYQATYMKSYEESENPQLLSFAWIISDVLAELAKINSIMIQQTNEGEELSSEASPLILTDGGIDKVQDSMELLCENFNKMTATMITEKLEGVSEIFQEINQLDVRVNLLEIGSALTKLLHTQSDLNFFLVKNVEETDDEGALKKIADIFRGQKNRVAMRRDRDLSLDIRSSRSGNVINITLSKVALRRSVFIRHCMLKYPNLANVLTVLHHWARRFRIIGNTREDAMRPEILSLLFLDFVRTEEHVPLVHYEDLMMICERYIGSKTDIWSSIERSTDVIYSGELLVKFLKFFGVSDLSLTKDPTNPDGSMICPYLTPSSSEAKRIRQCSLQAYHSVACNSSIGNITGSHGSTAQSHTIRSLSEESYASLVGAESFFARRLSQRTGAEVSIRRRDFNETPGLILEAWGDQTSMWRLEEQLQKIEGQSTIVTNARMSNSHVSESHETVLEGYQSKEDPIRLVRYTGEAHPQHDNSDRHVPLLRTYQGEGGKERDRFVESFLRQVQTVRNDYNPASHGDIRAIARFGNVYVLNGNGVDSCATVGEFDDEQVRFKDASSEFYSVSPIRPFRGRGGRGGRRGRGRGRGRGGHVRLNRGDFLRQQRCLMTSFIPNDAPSFALDDFLREYNFAVAETITKYNIQYRMDRNMSGVIVLDENQKFAELRLSHFKWQAFDVKRQVDPNAASNIGDVRLTIQSRRILSMDDVKKIQDYERFTNPDIAIIEGARNNLRVTPNFQNKIGCVRFKHIIKYRAQSNQLRNQFMSDVEVRVTEVDEHTRPDGNGRFEHVSRNRREITVIPKLPDLEHDDDSCKAFAREFINFCLEIGEVIRL